MAEIKNTIYQIEPNGLSGFRGLSNTDLDLIPSAEIAKTFKPNDNFIELSYFTLDEVRLLTIPNYTNYSILSGDTRNGDQGNSEISIDVEQDYISYGFQGNEVKALYNFLDYPYSDSLNPQDFYIESISSDRTELRLISVNLDAETIQEVTNELIAKYNNDVYTPDFHLYFRDNIFLSIVNIDVEEYRNTNAVLVKLYNPLPTSVRIKTRLNIVEKVADSIAYEINTDIIPDKPVIPTLRGANFNVEVEEQVTEPSQYFNYEELFSFPTNNSYRELNSLFNEKGVELGVDYSDFSNFINFSSAEERLRNFKYKLDLIDSYQTNLDIINTTGLTYTAAGITGSRNYYENLLNGVINNFDHYERHLYFESGSTSWPKTNTVKPYVNQASSTNEATTWYTAELEDAILYDAQNPNILTNTIPTYLKEDTSNEPYNLFIYMIGQHFDNLWIYTDAVSQKYNADNRLTRGVSKDLVEELLKNFGIKLYTSNKSVGDLFRYFTVNSYNTGEEYLPAGITTSGQQPVSQNDYQKEIYKRIYHNLPLLLKSKGTERGLRALINCFGIPSDILKIKVYGGQSVNDLPFFGGEQAWTGSIDKVRLDNTGSIVEGDTLSFYTGITNFDNKYTQDLHRIEVGFSPADNINSYILSQSAVLFPDDPFNIDDYIGDPREVSTNVYASLRTYADQIFENVGYYNLKDFVRLIKFFDNVIFRMVRDFVPARSVTDAGIIIKPHLLERSKHISPIISWTQPEYSGSIDTAFITGSNGGAYKSVGYNVTGSLFNRESSTRKHYYTQTPIGRRGIRDKWYDQSKFNGELHESNIKITNGELNSGNPFKNLEYPNVTYAVQFFLEPPSSACTLTTAELDRLVIVPNSTNSNFTNYNLGSMFQGTTGVYDYEVTSNGQTTVLTGQDVMYNFLQQGYQQYQLFEVTTYHEENDTLYGGTCTNTREAIIVSCDLSLILSNVPTQIIPGQSYNITTWWNSLNSINTEITYSINGVTYPSEDVEDIEFPETEYKNGQNITVVIRDSNNPTGCKLETTAVYNNCVIEAVNNNIFVNNTNEYVYPYGFSGVSTITTFSFRLEWCNGTPGLVGDFFCTSPQYIGVWVDIDPNTPITTGLLTEILSIYPDANDIDSDETITNPQYNTFELIQDYINSIQPNPSFPIQMRFRAQNNASCTVIHPNAVITGAPASEPLYNLYTVFYSDNVFDACCFNIEVNIYSTAESKNIFFQHNLSPIGSPVAPPFIYTTEDGTEYAPSGWYSDGNISRYWDGDYGFWNLSQPVASFQSTGYINCDASQYGECGNPNYSFGR
jgi:hypothetical protein